MDTSTAGLDAEELLHVALAAGLEGRHDRAIALLKQSWALDPSNAATLYCLGAEHAQIGLYERAMSEMERAIEMQPELDMARLQLGMLCLTCGHPDRGEAALKHLVDRDESDALGHFARGLVALVHDNLQNSIRSLEQGLGLNVSNEPLNYDMARLLESLKAGLGSTTGSPAPMGGGLGSGGAGDPEGQSEAGAGASGNLWMSSYRKAGAGR